MNSTVVSMSDEQLHEAVTQARRLLLNPGGVQRLPMEDAAALLIHLAAALCQVAPLELLAAPPKPRLVTPPASPAFVTTSSH